MQATGIIPGNSQAHAYKMQGNTADIIAAIREADKYGIAYVEDFAHTLIGEDTLETCRNIYDFVHSSIPYQEDADGRQLIQLPGELYNNRYTHLGGTGKGGDCKSMALMCSSLLRAVGFYDFKYRFTSSDKSVDFHHVYLVVNDGSDYISLDCTLPRFGMEEPFAKNKDVTPAHPADEKPIAAIGATTQIQYTTSYWEAISADWSKNIDVIRDGIRHRFMDGMWLANEGHPLKRSKIQQLVGQDWDNLLRFASACIYYYWNDSTLLPYYASRPGVVNPGPIPFPQSLTEKRETSIAFVQALKSLGARDADILSFISLSIWNTYGVTLEYMLYRCYCLELYGQPFAPVPGVPYFNLHTGTMIANGASLEKVLAITLCLPAQGGVGRPFGQPYWSTGGHIMLNGYGEEGANLRTVLQYGSIEAWAEANPRPGTPIGGDIENLTPGIIVNNGAGISDAAQAEALVIYNRWMAGNMVMLPQPVNPNKIAVTGPHIGEAITAIVSAVIAAIVAVVTIIATIVELVQKAKDAKNATNVALPLQDFQWDFETGDGCIIGHCINIDGCDGATTVKMCNGVIVEVNPNPANPANQPADPGNAFGGGSGNVGSNNKLIIGGSLALVAGGALLLKD